MDAPPEDLPVKELTPRVIVLGLVLSVVMGAANVYVGLKAGMTVSASIPAAVMAMLLFRWLFRHTSILEANQVQTCASAGESLAAGIIFTMPALIMIGFWDAFDYWVVSLVALSGGLLGILFMIPMRRVFVVDNDELKYPEGLACAAVLEAGDSEHASHGDAANLIAGGLLGAIVKFLGGFAGVLVGTLETARVVGGRVWYFGGDVSPMLMAVGFIVRLNIAVLIGIGGAISWLIAIPWFGGADAGADPVQQAGQIWSSEIRFIGVGAMVMGGFNSLWSVRHGLIAAIKHLRDGLRSSDQQDEETMRDLPTRMILVIGLICVVVLTYINYQFTHGVGITVLSTVVMLAMGFFFTAVASYIVGLVGNSNSPVSGMTITAVLVVGAMLYLFQYRGTDAMVATLGVAAIVCCVACTAGDVCNDLKTGSLVGAAPFRQQLMQILGVAIAAFVMAPVLTLLHEHTPGGIGGPELSAPQASLFASLASGFSGEIELPWNMIALGAMIGIAILLVDLWFQKSGSSHRAHLMPIAVGMYLPFGLAPPILIGGLIAHWHARRFQPDVHDRVLHRGVLFASGVIAGEALTAVGLAALAALGLKSMDLAMTQPVRIALSFAAVLLIVATFTRFSRPAESDS